MRSELRRGAASAWPRRLLGLCPFLLAAGLPSFAAVWAADGADTVDAQQGRMAEVQGQYQAAEQARLQLVRENAELRERLQQQDGYAELSRRLAEQGKLLGRLAKRLETPGEAASGDDATVENDAMLRAQLEDAERRLQLLIEQFGQAHQLRIGAESEAAAARAQVAELSARLQQQQQAMDEARMRADKAEKLNASLEEARARALTENERLTLELAATKERQAKVLQRVVDLDSRLAVTEARAGQTASASPTAADAGGQVPGSDAAAPVAPAADIPPAEPPVATTGSTAAATPAADIPPAEPPVATTDSTAAAKTVIYQVRADDTLSRISAQVYGDASAWPRIFEANRDLLATPDDLSLGMNLVIP